MCVILLIGKRQNFAGNFRNLKEEKLFLLKEKAKLAKQDVLLSALLNWSANQGADLRVFARPRICVGPSAQGTSISIGERIDFLLTLRNWSYLGYLCFWFRYVFIYVFSSGSSSLFCVVNRFLSLKEFLLVYFSYYITGYPPMIKLLVWLGQIQFPAKLVSLTISVWTNLNLICFALQSK